MTFELPRLCLHTITTRPWDLETAVEKYAQAGIGGITALIIIISVAFKSDMTLLLSLAIFISGIIASVRLALKAHTPAQLAVGYAVGFLIVSIFLAQLFI